MRLDSEMLVDATTDPAMREKELAWIRSSLAEAMREIRTICRGLVLPEIEGVSFEEIIERVVSAHETRTASAVARNVEDDHSDLSAAVKICVYRFVQEALNNAYRHGGGIEQSVTAQARGSEVRIEVRDQGDGFDPNEVRPTSLGLAGLRERVDSLGGDFDIKTGSAGTVVSMTLRLMELEAVR